MTTIKQFNPGNGQWETVLVGAPGPPGPKGDTGSAGANGSQGPAGVGVPVGGAAGQVLSKINATDYNTQWSNPGFDQGAADLRYLQLAGGTLTGPLTVEDSTTVLELISQGTIVAQSGISVSAGGISVVSGNVTAPQVRASTAAPVAINDLTRKDYVDGLIAGRLTQAAADTRYLQLAGGTLTGPLVSDPASGVGLTINGPGGAGFGGTLYLSHGGTGSIVGMLMTFGSMPNTALFIRTSNSSNPLQLASGGSAQFTLSGGNTITAANPITLPNSDPTQSNHAARKSYVDLRVLKAGDTMTGALTIDLAGNNQLIIKGTTQSDVRLQSATGTAWGSVVAVATGTDLMTHPAGSVVKLRPELTDVLTIAKTLITAATPIALPADPASALHAVTKQYVDGLAAQVTLDSRYVNVAGDLMTGTLRTDGSFELNRPAGTRTAYWSSLGGSGGFILSTETTAGEMWFSFGGSVQFEANNTRINSKIPIEVPTPTAVNHATRKDYVDAQVATRLTQALADTRYVSLTGSDSISGFKTFTDDLMFTSILWFSDYSVGTNVYTPGVVFDSGEFSIGDITGGGPGTFTAISLQAPLIIATGPVALPADPASALHAATKQYVDSKTGTNPQVWEGTQAQFDALATIDPTWFYYVVP